MSVGFAIRASRKPWKSHERNSVSVEAGDRSVVMVMNLDSHVLAP